MAELRDALRPGLGNFVPSPDAYRRVLERRDRRARNRRLGAFAVVAAIAIAGVVFAVTELRSAPSIPIDPVPPTPRQEVFLFGVDDGTTTPFPSPLDGWSYRFSPDGTQVAFTALDADGEQMVYVMDRDGTDLEVLTDGNFHIWVGTDTDEPAWSPDGGWLAVSGNSRHDDHGNLLFVSVPIHPQTRDHSTPRSGFGTPTAVVSEPSWSPDGKFVAFTLTGEEGPRIATLRTVRYFGGRSITVSGTPQTLVEGATAFSWSSDGTRSVFVSADTGRVMVADARGGDARAIDDGSGANPSWSPDGSRIAYDDLPSGRVAIYDVASGSTRILDVDGCFQDWSDDATVLVTACVP
jgi:Tol biopolymer transport system component